MRLTSPRSILAGALLAALLAPPAAADISVKSKKLEAKYEAGVNTRSGDLALSRLSVTPSMKLKFDRKWRSEIELRLELADDDVGLGTTETYSSISRPILRSSTTRLSIEKATLNYKSNGTRMTLGKQTMSWGVLDGLQILDQFDPVRQRDFVLSEPRPERISRWGASVQKSMDDWTLELAAAFDPTASQLAQPGRAFSPTSPRFTAGLPANAQTVPLRVDSRNDYVADATTGVRLRRKLKSGSLTFVAIDGPEHLPVFELDAQNPGGVLLTYPDRQVYGASYDAAIGSTVLRFEAAYTPDYTLNTVAVSPLQPIASSSAKRYLAGVGIDWQTPGDIFINAQIGVDHVDVSSGAALRPDTETIYSFMARKGFRNDRFQLEAELIGSTEAGDGVASVNLEYELSDNVSLSLGTDYIHGNKNGLFGQFRKQSRIVSRLKWSI